MEAERISGRIQGNQKMINVVLFVAAATSCLASASPQHYVLAADAGVWDVAVEDVDGDGKADITALCCDGESEPLDKFVAVYLADSKGRYSPEPTFTHALNASTGTLFFAETDAEPPRELVAADAEGAMVFEFEDGRFEAAAVSLFRSLLPSGSQEPLFLDKTAQDLDRDGIDEWLIPIASGYSIRNAAGEICRVSCHVVSEIRPGTSMYITHRLPAYHLFEHDPTAPKGIAFLSDEFADFAYGPDWSEHKRLEIPLNLEEKWEAGSRMADVNKDGLPDLVVTQTKGTVHISALTQVYVAQAPFTYPNRPTAMFEAEGAITTPTLEDVDGDEDLDILFVSIPFGIKNLINFFLREKLSVNVEVYYFSGGGFPDKPDIDTAMTLDAPEGRQRVAYTLGDFNGDGRLDVAFGKEEDELAVLLGSPDRFVSRDPWVEFELPTFGEARARDLDGNKAQDIVIWHPTGDYRKRMDVIVF